MGEPPASSARAPSVAGLPVHLTSFVGRRRALADIAARVRAARLVTLSGAGGSGKTRLAAELVRQLQGDWPHGVVWVELAPVAEPAGVAGAVAAAAGLPDVGARGPVAALSERFRTRAPLLVLDNCEHVLDACAELTDALLRACTDLHVLATSREPLAVEGEIAWAVPPLELPAADSPPTADRLRGSEAVQLFVERAQAARVAFELTDANAPAVLQICRRLDALPLALELAAARIRTMSPEQIAGRLDDAFRLLTGRGRGAVPRHRTLRAAIEWSHALLTPREQAMLARLAVFSGGFTLEAAEAVCAGAPIEEHEVLDLLAALVDKSLVALTEGDGQPRYHLLETVRQYAAERLHEGVDEPTLRDRHLAHYAGIAAEAGPHLAIISPTRAAWIPRLLPEHDNLRAALLWARRQPEHAGAELRLLADTWWLWHHLGQVGEARRWLRDALERTPEAPSPARATVLLGAAFTSWMQGDDATAAGYQARSVELWRRLGDRAPFLVRALAIHGHILRDLGDLPASRRAAEEAVAAAAAGRGLPGDDAFAAICLGNTQHAEGDLDAADATYRAGEARWRRTGQAIGLAFALWSRAVLALDRGDLGAAAALARESLQTARVVPNAWFLCRPLEALAAALARAGEARPAATLFGVARAIRARLGTPMPAFDRQRYGATFDELRGALGSDAYDAALAAGGALTLEAALAFAQAPATAAPAPAAPSAASPAAASSTPQATAPGASPPSPGMATPHPSGAPGAASAGGAVPALHVQALGPLRIESGGEDGDAGRWSLAKPRELLLFLLMHPAGATREQVGVALWPEASKAQVSNNFHVTLHRLRKALGASDRVVTEQERYRLHPALDTAFDVPRFERIASGALADPEPARRRAALQEAVALYRGDFLEGEVVGDWHQEHRDRLHRLHSAVLLALGDDRAASGEHAAAAETFQRLLVREPFREDVYRRLMECHARMDQRTAALALYQRLTALLEAEFGAEPQAETTSLYRRLRADLPAR